MTSKYIENPNTLLYLLWLSGVIIRDGDFKKKIVHFHPGKLPDFKGVLQFITVS